MGELLRIHPSELKFPFEQMKQSSCTMQLINKTDKYVAFKVKTTNPKKYCVRPNAGVVLPGSTSDVTVTMQAQKEAPSDMQCKDKFLIQSVVAPEGTTIKEITPELFNKEVGKVVDELRLRVVYILANPPSPVPEVLEEGSSPKASLQEDGDGDTLLSDAVSKSFEMHKDKSSEPSWPMISKLTDERTNILQQNHKLQQELESMRKRNPNRGGGFSLLLVVFIFFVAFFLGYLLKQG